MKKTYIAAAVASLMTLWGGAANAENIAYQNQGSVGTGEDLVAQYGSDYDRIVKITNGSKTFIDGYNLIDWLFNDPTSGDGAIYAANQSELTISANKINITSKGDPVKAPNFIHAYGGSVSLYVPQSFHGPLATCRK